MKVERHLAAILLAGAFALAASCTGAQDLATVSVRASGEGPATAFEGVVEAVQQASIAAQVAGVVTRIAVRSGDRVAAGQVLAHIDDRAAQQSLAASEAQTRSAHAELEVAIKELERQRLLFERKFTSRAALDRAEAQFKATDARVSALAAEAGAARAQSGHFVVKAPYAGVIAEVPAMPGDMAMPGRILLTLYDPRALRVTAAVPESAAADARAAAGIRVEIPALGDATPIAPAAVEVLPTADPGTHTVQVRFVLPQGTQGVRPGMFARAWLPGTPGEVARLWVPASSVVRRAELAGVYVVDAEGRPRLRQVRLGRARDGEMEVLAGVAAGERVAIDAQVAARYTAAAQ